MFKKLNKLILNSQRILITSHISPDPDAYCSALLLGRTLKLNFPKIKTEVVLEETATNLKFLQEANTVKHTALLAAVKKFKPDLLIMLDGNNYERFSRLESVPLRQYVRTNKVKTVIIDHHEKFGADKVDLYIHRGSPATTQDVYWLCFEELGLKKPIGFQDTTMMGILSDTGRFLYQNKLHRETYKITSELLDAGVNIEALTNRMSQYSIARMSVISELSANLSQNRQYSYSLISDGFARSWRKDQTELKAGCEAFVNIFIRNIEGRIWGFVVYPDLQKGGGFYGVSLRSINGTVDVSKIAKILGGGGHKPAAGASFAARNAKNAARTVQQAIAKAYPSLVE